MAKERLRVAQVDGQVLERIHALENELGACVVAYQPKPQPDAAKLSADQVQRLRQAEEDLDVVLIAYACGE